MTELKLFVHNYHYTLREESKKPRKICIDLKETR